MSPRGPSDRPLPVTPGERHCAATIAGHTRARAQGPTANRAAIVATMSNSHLYPGLTFSSYTFGDFGRSDQPAPAGPQPETPTLWNTCINPQLHNRSQRQRPPAHARRGGTSTSAIRGSRLRATRQRSAPRSQTRRFPIRSPRRRLEVGTVEQGADSSASCRPPHRAQSPCVPSTK